MFLKGECADFPDSWSDRMWGPDDLPNQRTQYELRRAAVRIDLCLGNRLELDPDFFDSNDIDSTRGGRPSTENRARGNPGSHVDRGYGDGDTGKPQLTGEPRFTAVTPPPAHLVSYSTSLVRNNPSAPTGHLPASGETSPDDDGIREDGSWADAAGAEPPSSESAEAGSDAEAVCRTMADGLRAMPPMPVPEPLARPGKRELDAARRLIDLSFELAALVPTANGITNAASTFIDKATKLLLSDKIILTDEQHTAVTSAIAIAQLTVKEGAGISKLLRNPDASAEVIAGLRLTSKDKQDAR